MLKLFTTKSSRESIAKQEIKASHFIPYKFHLDKNTIVTKAGEMIQVVKVEGFSFETADPAEIDGYKNMRNMLLKGMSTSNVTVYSHIIRKKRPLKTSSYPIDPYAKETLDFTSLLEEEWRNKYNSFDNFSNDLYFTIVLKSVDEDIPFKQSLNKIFSGGKDDGFEEEKREMLETMHEMSNRVVNTFRGCEPKLLGIIEEKNGHYCEILKFFGTIINCGNEDSMQVPLQPLDEYLCTNRLFFGTKAIESRSAKGTKYAGIISVIEYCTSTWSGILDSFLQMPNELIITQSFTFTNRSIAIQKMQIQQNRMIQAEDKAVSQISEISEALDKATSGEICFGEHHLTIMVMDENLKALENSLSLNSVELSNCGIQPVREKMNMEACFWGQLPGNSHFIARKCLINSLNLSGFMSYHNYPTGKVDGNHWGEYITIMETMSGTPYYFNFHVRDVGHTLIIGPTGAGKTVLMNFLCAQAQKFKCRMFFFDKDRGAEIFIRALNGVHILIDPAKKCALNPLQLPDNGESRAFLLEWLKLLVSSNGEKVTAEDIKVLNLAIDGNYRIQKEDRKLSNIIPFLGMDTPDSLASRISMWHGKGARASVFDSAVDNLDLAHSRVFGFEMAELLKDPISLGPVLLYIFHKINLALDGYPTIIVLDEAWALIDNPIFGPKIKDWLKVLRKLNTMVIFATQSVEDAAKSAISDTLIQQTATQIFLPNLKATDVYRKSFMLTNAEYGIVRSTDPSSRFFLVKQGVTALVARINLQGMDKLIDILSGRADTVIMLDEIRAKYSSDPIVWMPLFFEKMQELREQKKLSQQAS
jgi:type IV secretion system protein VirB4